MNEFIPLAFLAGIPVLVWTSITISRLVEELHELKKRVMELESEQGGDRAESFHRKVWSTGLGAERDLLEMVTEDPILKPAQDRIQPDRASQAFTF